MTTALGRGEEARAGLHGTLVCERRGRPESSVASGRCDWGAGRGPACVGDGRVEDVGDVWGSVLGVFEEPSVMISSLILGMAQRWLFGSSNTEAATSTRRLSCRLVAAQARKASTEVKTSATGDGRPAAGSIHPIARREWGRASGKSRLIDSASGFVHVGDGAVPFHVETVVGCWSSNATHGAF